MTTVEFAGASSFSVWKEIFAENQFSLSPTVIDNYIYNWRLKISTDAGIQSTAE